MRLTFSQSIVFSSICHGALLFAVWHGRHTVIPVPLSVDLIKITEPIKKALEKKLEEPVVKEKKEHVKIKETKDDVSKEQPKTVSQPAASTHLTVDAIKFPYMYYLVMIRKKVATRWDWPASKGVLKSIVYFKILQTGKIVDIQLDMISGNELFDHAALRAIQLCERFPPLPGGFEEEYLGVYFEFSFRE